MTFRHLIEQVSEPSWVNTAGASAAATSMFWLEWLRQVSDIAAVILPLLGCMWLGMQMYVFIRKHLK